MIFGEKTMKIRLMTEVWKGIVKQGESDVEKNSERFFKNDNHEKKQKRKIKQNKVG